MAPLELVKEEEEDAALVGGKQSRSLPQPSSSSKRTVLLSLVVFVLMVAGLALLTGGSTSLVDSDEVDNLGEDGEDESIYEVEDDDAEAGEAGGECLPQACFQGKHFVSSPKLLAAGPMPHTLLASFPGSGNTWIRFVVEEATRVWTGSVYMDPALYKQGFLGERTPPFASSSSASSKSLSMIKTHFPYYRVIPIDPKATAAVVLLRRPHDALLSEFSRRRMRFNRTRGGDNGLDEHTARADVDRIRTGFPAFFHTAGASWTAFMQFWLTPAGSTAKQRVEHDAGVVSFRLQVKPNAAGTGPGAAKMIPVLALFYEDFISEFAVTTRVLLEFVKTHGLDRAMPSVDDALQCAVQAWEQSQHGRRQHDAAEEEYNPFTDGKGIMAKNHFLDLFCKEAERFWFAGKWGDCLDGSELKPRKGSTGAKKKKAVAERKRPCD